MSGTEIMVLLRRHLTDLQLANDPNQDLIARTVARLIELEEFVLRIETAVSSSQRSVREENRAMLRMVAENGI